MLAPRDPTSLAALSFPQFFRSGNLYLRAPAGAGRAAARRRSSPWRRDRRAGRRRLRPGLRLRAAGRRRRTLEHAGVRGAPRLRPRRPTTAAASSRSASRATTAGARFGPCSSSLDGRRRGLPRPGRAGRRRRRGLSPARTWTPTAPGWRSAGDRRAAGSRRGSRPSSSCRSTAAPASIGGPTGLGRPAGCATPARSATPSSG